MFEYPDWKVWKIEIVPVRIFILVSKELGSLH